MTSGAGTDSAVEIPPGSVVDLGPGEPWPENDSVAAAFDDLEIPAEPERPRKDDKAKAGPPRLDEWQDFISRVLIKGLTERYVSWAFRGIDEEKLTDREVARLAMSEQERSRIARPFAELANKTKITRKHGRSIIALSDSVDSILALGMWFSRVNRIAGKYAKDRPVRAQVVREDNVGTGPYAENGSQAAANGFSHGFWPESPGTG